MTPPKKDTPTVAEQVANMVPVEPEGSTPVPSEDSPEQPPEMPPEVQQSAATGNLDPEVARVMAEMQTTITQLNERLTKSEAAQGEVTEEGASGYPWQYYVKPDIGPEASWVIIGPGGSAKGGRRNASAFANKVARGHKALMQYGVAAVPSDTPLPGQPFWSMIEKGGAKEFPASQVLAYRWHQNPPVEGVTFPQYEVVKNTIKEFQCDECELELSFLPDDTFSPRACFNHLRNAHQYPRSEAKATMDAQGIKTIAPYAIRREAQELADSRLKVAPDA